MLVEIASATGRREVDMGEEWIYVYIPMTKREAKKYAKNIVSPCWRIRMFKERGEEEGWITL